MSESNAEDKASMEFEWDFAAMENDVNEFMKTFDVSCLDYVPLATPENLARDLATQIDDLPPENVGGFINVCLLAATTNRKVVEDYLNKPKWSALVSFIKKHFFYKDRLTFSQLNLIGLCILAVSGETTDAFANANFKSIHSMVSKFRSMLGGAKSIWDADIGASRFSAERKRIYMEQKQNFSAQSVAENGATIVKILNDKYQSGIKASDTQPFRFFTVSFVCISLVLTVSFSFQCLLFISVWCSKTGSDPIYSLEICLSCSPSRF